MDLLTRLVAEARQETERRRALVPEGRLEEAAARQSPRDFVGALRAPGLSVIAEMKQRTPSMGVLAEDYRPGELARIYTQGGAVAISVLTHMAGFGGCPEHIELAREHTQLPILRKDFVTDAYQVVEARAAGADAVLLIVSALEAGTLAELVGIAHGHGLAALVEVHDEAEAALAVEAGARAVGVNNRDLRAFKVDLGMTERLRRLIPADLVLVSESGIHTHEDAQRMRDAGADAILVGEALMRASDPAACIRQLVSGL